jgi:glycosyltransferase involved in cell wall biosynthesis
MKSEIENNPNKLFNLIERIVYRRASKIQFVSNFSRSKSLLKNHIKSEIIYNSTPFEYFLTSESKNIFSDSKTVNIFSVRSIESRARIDLLITVAKLIGNGFTFYIAGKGPLLNKFRKQIENDKIENIKLLGYLSDIDLVSYYKCADLIILTADRGEGFGLPIIEGYLFNKPVIASNVCASISPRST